MSRKSLPFGDARRLADHHDPGPDPATDNPAWDDLIASFKAQGAGADRGVEFVEFVWARQRHIHLNTEYSGPVSGIPPYDYSALYDQSAPSGQGCDGIVQEIGHKDADGKGVAGDANRSVPRR